MGYTPEFYFKSEYRRIYAILEARKQYYENSGGCASSDNEAKALQTLDNFLG